jgi:hypothetical protein
MNQETTRSLIAAEAVYRATAAREGLATEAGVQAELLATQMSKELLLRSAEEREVSRRRRERWKIWFGGFAGLWGMTLVNQIVGKF